MPRRKVIPLLDGVKAEEEDQREESQTIAVETNDVKPQVALVLKQEDDGQLVPESDPIAAVGTDEEGQLVVSTDDEAAGSDKRNLSLEALFQAAHSELENISKKTVTGAKVHQAVKKQILTRVSTDKEQIKVGDVVAYLEVPQEMEKGTYIIRSGEEEGGVAVKMEEQEQVPLPLPVTVGNNQILHIMPASSQSTSAVSSSVLEGIPKGTPTFVIGTASESFPSKAVLTPDLTKLFVVNHTAVGTEMKGITTAIGRGGRTRKHPQKPGKYICPYCNRGCTKPSVLTKHIRAHTGERPYPCSTCGFAFKTKSNLYKHCKSRWHLLKVGLSKEHSAPNGKQPISIDVDSDEMSSDEGDGDVKESEPVSQTPVSIESISGLIGGRAGKRTMTRAPDGDVDVKRRRESCEMSVDDETETAVKNVKLQSGGMVIDRQASGGMLAEPTAVTHAMLPPFEVQTKISKQDTNLTVPQPLESGRVSPVLSDSAAVPQAALRTSSSSTSSVTTSIVCMMSANLQTAVSRMSLPIKVTPTVVQSSATRKAVEKSFSTSDLPEEKNARSKQAALSHSISLQVDGSASKDTKNPKMLAERISNLISANQAIVSTSVAIPPRKRVVRQPSISPSIPLQSSVPALLYTQPVALFQRSASLTDKLQMVKNASQPAAVAPHVDMVRSLSVPAIVLTSSSGMQPPEPMFVVKQIEMAQDRVMTKPVMQLPQGMLPAVSGANTPKEIKIEFRLPRSMGSQATKTGVESAASSSGGQSVEFNIPAGHLPESSMSRVSRANLSHITKDRPQLAAILQGQNPALVSGTSQMEKQSSVFSVRQDFGLGSSFQPTMKISGQIPESKTVSVDGTKLKPAKLTLPSTSEIALQPKPTLITVVTPPTPTETKKRGILQRQKNVIVEMVDPLQPPKRGRPKGARSVDSSFFGTASSADDEKLSLQRSHSTVESGLEIPGELRGETPQALWKLKLKGRLLMKRSMSVERMLSQERELEHGAEKQGKATLSPPSARHMPLLRSKSYDETIVAQQKPSRDAEVRERILSKLSKSCHNLTRGDSGDVSDEEEKAGHVNASIAEPSTSSEATCGSPAVTSMHESKQMAAQPLLSVSTPVNRAAVHFPTFMPTYAPLSVMREVNSVPDLQQPNMISIPVNIAHKVPGLLEEAKLKSPGDGISGAKKAVPSQQAECMEYESFAPVDDKKKPERETGEEKGLGVVRASSADDGGVGSEHAVKVSEASDVKKNVCTLHTIQMAGPSKQVQDRITITLLLLGHAYPSMKTRSISTFCCIHKTQPTYVIVGNQQKVSMYSNWCTAPYDPNPKGLASKQLLDLYQSQRYDCEPRFIVAGGSSGTAECTVTQSSYWSVKDKDGNGKDGSSQAVGKEAKMETFPDIKDAHLHDPVPEERRQSVPKKTVESVPEVPKEMYVFTTAKNKLKEALSSEKSTKIRICDGGYKSTEDYVYVRGRGRGMYVCEECGIRCKKPSMLKKHIRTHTDVRPYHCRYCNFAFKTKGNLTKHMKSKAHQKLCMDKGIIPVPSSVDDDCMVNIMSDSVDESDSGVIYEDIDGPTVGHMEEVSDHQFSDAEDQGCDEDEDDDKEELTEEKSSDKEGIDEVQLVEVEVVTNPIETSLETELKVIPSDGENFDVTRSETGKGPQSLSLDKEIAAASLLDLSKVTNTDCKDSNGQNVSSEDGSASELSSGENQPANKKEPVTESKVANYKVKDTAQNTVMTKDITLFSTFGYIRRQNTYERKIALLKAANQCHSSDFVPAIGLLNDDSSVLPVQSHEKWSEGVKKATEDLGPIVGQFIRPDLPPSTEKSDERSPASPKSPSSVQRRMLQLAKVSTSGVASLEAKVRFVEDEGHAPCEIIPVPIRTSDEAEQADERGRFACQVCAKAFDKRHQLVLHRKIHVLERPHRCDDCSLSFQSRMLFDKHQSSDKHQQQVALMQQVGGATSEDPRPFKCEDCNIAFRIQGHLARHLRSKMHISKLEALGKVPAGSYDQVDFVPATTAATSASAPTTTTSPPCAMTASAPPTDAAAVQKCADALPRAKLVRRPSACRAESEPCAAKLRRLDESPLEVAVDDDSDRAPKRADVLPGPLPVHDAAFSYQTSDEYEKVDRASNDRVTVEIKSEPIEFGEILPKMSQKPEDRESGMEQENEAFTTDGPHKCGICGKTFKEISSLKHHLVSHAELRPYVCEYCDAGFTTALSLKYHLPMHAQERPYLCGYCGSTFSKSELLHQHLNEFHSNQAFEPANQTAAGCHVTKPAGVPSAGLAAKQKVHRAVHVVDDALVSSEPGQMAETHSPIKDSEAVEHRQPAAVHSFHPSAVSTRSRLGSAGGGGLVRQMAIDGDSLPAQKVPESHATADVVELDVDNCKVEESIEDGPDGEQHTIYMLFMPDGKQEGSDLLSPADVTVAGPNGRAADALAGPLQLSSASGFRMLQSEGGADADVVDPQRIGIQTDSGDPAVRWKVIHVLDNSMALSPIFDTEENADAQNLDHVKKSV